MRAICRAAVAVIVLVVTLGVVDAPPASASATKLRGSGSTYVGLAMQQWINDASTLGIRVDYAGNGSPGGLTDFAGGTTDFAGTEAEYSGLAATGQTGGEVQRGYQYVPDVAGAIAVMYNIKDTAGRKPQALRLSPRTIARIFTGGITSWSDPAIAADNAAAGTRLPDIPIEVVFRSGKSGTTALFYDFVANVAPDIFVPWARANNLPEDNKAARLVTLDLAQNFAPTTVAFGGSDQIAKETNAKVGRIAYDEFGYAKTHRVPVAWVSNGAGRWTQPEAVNITAALESAQLRPDLTQELSRVYTSSNPLAYPISAYSYLVTQCAPSADRPTCKGSYADAGTAEALARWMRMIACDGQIEMAVQGYSPLPPELSQEVANSIGRMQGKAPERLNAGNCANPRMRGVRPPPPPVDPIEKKRGAQAGQTGPGGPGGQAGGGPGATGAGPDATAPGSAGTVPEGATTDPESQELAGGLGDGRIPGRVGGGSGLLRAAQPVEYTRPLDAARSHLPLVMLLLVLIVPAVISGTRARRRTAQHSP